MSRFHKSPCPVCRQPVTNQAMGRKNHIAACKRGRKVVLMPPKTRSHAQEKLDDAADVLALRPPGTILTRNGRQFIVGVKKGVQFWLMCLDPAQKQLTDARSILRDYEKVQS